MSCGMGGIKHTAESVANKKRPERTVLSGLFFLKTAMMTTTLTVRRETGNPVMPAFLFPPDYCFPAPKVPHPFNRSPQKS